MSCCDLSPAGSVVDSRINHLIPLTENNSQVGNHGDMQTEEIEYLHRVTSIPTGILT